MKQIHATRNYDQKNTEASHLHRHQVKVKVSCCSMLQHKAYTLILFLTAVSILKGDIIFTFDVCSDWEIDDKDQDTNVCKCHIKYEPVVENFSHLSIPIDSPAN